MKLIQMYVYCRERARSNAYAPIITLKPFIYTHHYKAYQESHYAINVSTSRQVYILRIHNQ